MSKSKMLTAASDNIFNTCHDWHIHLSVGSSICSSSNWPTALMYITEQRSDNEEWQSGGRGGISGCADA